jgi:hypothetical protein
VTVLASSIQELAKPTKSLMDTATADTHAKRKAIHRFFCKITGQEIIRQKIPGWNINFFL